MSKTDRAAGLAELQRLGQEFDAAPDKHGWRDIASAPKDGSAIWVACPGSMRVAYWYRERSGYPVHAHQMAAPPLPT